MADTVYPTPVEPFGSTSPHGSSITNDEKKFSNEFQGEVVAREYDVSGHNEGVEKFKQLSWVRLTTCLIVEAVALGALSLPHAYATLGLPAGVVLTIGIGLVSVYTAYLVGQVCNRQWPIQVLHYTDIGELMWGRWGREIVGVGFIAFLILVTGSHALTGAIALDTIADGRACKLVWSIVSAVVLVSAPPETLCMLIY